MQKWDDIIVLKKNAVFRCKAERIAEKLLVTRQIVSAEILKKMFFNDSRNFIISSISKRKGTSRLLF
jgi:hypothetical protein